MTIQFTKYLSVASLGALILVALLRLLTLSSYPLLDPTEGRYAEISREMVVSNDWITPHLEPGLPFWGKPPLSFWLTAVSYEILGTNEFSSRLPSFLLALLSATLTFYLARSMYGKNFAFLCCAILISMGLFYPLAGMVMTDQTLAAAVTLSMVAFALAIRSELNLSRYFWGYSFFVGLGLSVLAKGLLGWALILIPIAAWLTVQRRCTQDLKRLPCFSGAILTLCIAGPWHILAELKTPGFLDYYFVGEHFKRYFVSGWISMYGTAHNWPRGSIWGFLFVAGLPWVIILAAAGLWLRKRNKLNFEGNSGALAMYLILWAVTPLFIFTLARNILLPYVLSSLPALAILTGLSVRLVKELSVGKIEPWFVRSKVLGASFLLIPLVFSILSITLMPHRGAKRSQRDLVARFEDLSQLPNDQLMYLDTMPNTADFYAKGRAKEIDTATQLAGELASKELGFYVLNKSHLLNVPPEILTRTEEVGHFGQYILRKEIAPNIVR